MISIIQMNICMWNGKEIQSIKLTNRIRVLLRCTPGMDAKLESHPGPKKNESDNGAPATVREYQCE